MGRENKLRFASGLRSTAESADISPPYDALHWTKHDATTETFTRDLRAATFNSFRGTPCVRLHPAVSFTVSSFCLDKKINFDTLCVCMFELCLSLNWTVQGLLFILRWLGGGTHFLHICWTLLLRNRSKIFIYLYIKVRNFLF